MTMDTSLKQFIRSLLRTSLLVLLACLVSIGVIATVGPVLSNQQASWFCQYPEIYANRLERLIASFCADVAVMKCGQKPYTIQYRRSQGGDVYPSP
jgi:hypothetical protein